MIKNATKTANIQKIIEFTFKQLSKIAKDKLGISVKKKQIKRFSIYKLLPLF